MKSDNQTEWKYILYNERKPDFSPPKLMHARSELRKIYNTAQPTHTHKTKKFSLYQAILSPMLTSFWLVTQPSPTRLQVVFSSGIVERANYASAREICHPWGRWQTLLYFNHSNIPKENKGPLVVYPQYYIRQRISLFCGGIFAGIHKRWWRHNLLSLSHEQNAVESL